MLPPPDPRTGTDPVKPERWLRNSLRTTYAVFVFCAFGWTGMGWWVVLAKPDRFGAGRILFTMGLVVATVSAPIVWWLAVTFRLLWQDIRAVVLEQATRDAIAGLTAGAGAKLRSVDSASN